MFTIAIHTKTGNKAEPEMLVPHPTYTRDKETKDKLELSLSGGRRFGVAVRKSCEPHSRLLTRCKRISHPAISYKCVCKFYYTPFPSSIVTLLLIWSTYTCSTDDTAVAFEIRYSVSDDRRS